MEKLQNINLANQINVTRPCQQQQLLSMRFYVVFKH